MLRIPHALLGGLHRSGMDEVLGPFEVSQTKLGCQILEIGLPSPVAVCAHGGEGRCPSLAEIVDGEIFEAPAALEIGPLVSSMA